MAAFKDFLRMALGWLQVPAPPPLPGCVEIHILPTGSTAVYALPTAMIDIEVESC